MSTSFKVLHVAWSLGQGGAERYLADLLIQHQSFGEHVSEVLVLSSRGSLSETVERLGVPVTYLNMRSGTDIQGIIRLRSYLRSHKYDIIHSHTNNLAFTWLLGSIPGAKLYTEHGGGLLGAQPGGGWKDRLVYKYFHHAYDVFVAISNAMAGLMVATSPQVASRICVVHNGTDITAIDTAKACDKDVLPEGFLNARYRVGIVGRLSPEKGISNFVETAAVISRSNSGVAFAVVGDGPLRKELESQACDLGMADKIFFLGYRPDARSVIKHFDVFLFTSNTEGFGLVLIEAMAAGIPVVALNLTGVVREIIDDGVNGFVVDEKDYEVLAQRVEILLNDPELRERFVRGARDRVERCFTIEHNARRMLEIYRECL